VRRATEASVFATLQPIDERSHSRCRYDVVAIYRAIFRNDIERDGRMCLIGMLGVEAGGPTPEVREKSFAASVYSAVITLMWWTRP
jgi:hypothetical protein